jgi:hypothetical protein
MDYCTTLFGKPLDGLIYDDIVKFFISERIETDQLEFKSFSGQLNQEAYNGLIRTLAAFLNSNGGVLIWGAPAGETLPGRNEKIFKGAPTPINEVLVKDSLISRCSDKIIPLPKDLKVKIIEEKGTCLCVFEVASSDYAPHQFNNHYLMRIDGQTKHAPHHYVDALFKRIRFPQLEAYIKFLGARLSGRVFIIDIELYFFNFSPIVNVEDLSFRLRSSGGMFDLQRINVRPDWYGIDGNVYIRRPFQTILHYGEPLTDTNRLHIPKSTTEQVHLFLMFGGRNTPAKMNQYYLDFSKISDDAEDIVVKRLENKFYKDLEEELGLTRELTLRSYLNRNIQ